MVNWKFCGDQKKSTAIQCLGNNAVVSCRGEELHAGSVERTDGLAGVSKDSSASPEECVSPDCVGMASLVGHRRHAHALCLSLYVVGRSIHAIIT